jgi:hypothetical protein
VIGLALFFGEGDEVMRKHIWALSIGVAIIMIMVMSPVLAGPSP